MSGSALAAHMPSVSCLLSACRGGPPQSMAGVCKDPDQKAGHPEGRAQVNNGCSVSIKGERDKEKS